METRYVSMESMEIRAEDGRHYIEGICVPYGVVTDKAPRREMFERGAFRDLLAKAGTKIKLKDYNHSGQRVPVGYSATFQDREQGLWARFRLNNTPEGESARLNALDGVYQGLSVGFLARAEENRAGVRVVTDAWLDHVSLVEDPAYDDARILDVRAAADWRQEFAWMRDRSGLLIPTPETSQAPFSVAVSRMRNC